jgi:hypothetical protein
MRYIMDVSQWHGDEVIILETSEMQYEAASLYRRFIDDIFLVWTH